MEVVYHPEAEVELRQLHGADLARMERVIAKLEAMGITLPFPHQSAIEGGSGLRELRPRQGDSPHRAFYRRVGDVMVIAGLGPEAGADPQGFSRAVGAALARLESLEV